MKHFAILLFLAWSFSGISSLQAQRVYSYDLAGNRISRSVVVLRSALQSSQETDSISERIEKEGIARSLLTSTK